MIKIIKDRTLAFVALAFMLACFAGGQSAFAQVDLTAPSQETEIADPEPVIEADTDGPTDEAIGERLSAIFAEIPALNEAEVNVTSGVVTLSGIVPSVEDIDRAAAIATRVSGVVTVENKLSRNLDVGENLSPISDRLSERFSEFTSTLPLILVALLIVAAFWLLGGFLSRLTTLWRWLTPNVFLAELVATSVNVIFVVIGLILALDLLQATALIGALLGSAGLIGLAIGFAVRDAVNNYVSSIMLSIRQPFRAKDHVVIGQHEGHVIRLTSRATILMTLDGNHLRIPNSTVFQAEILNYTTNCQRRLEFDLGIDADDDPGAAIETGLEEMRALTYILNDPEPEAHIEQVGDSNIVIRYLFWIDQNHTDLNKARSGAIRAVKNVLESGGFGLPEPIYRLRFDSGNPLEIARSKNDAKSAKEPQRKLPAPRHADVSKNDTISRKVEGERRESGEHDILDSERPME